MSTAVRLAIGSVKGGARRLVSVILAITLGVAFVAATLMVGDSFRATLDEQVAGSVGDASVVVTSTGAGQVPRALADEMRAAYPHDRVGSTAEGFVMQNLGNRSGALILRTVPAMTERTHLTAGRLPQAPGEIALAAATAEGRQLSVGDTTTLLTEGAAGGGNTGGAQGAVEATVVGLIEPGSDVEAGGGLPLAFAADADIWAWGGTDGYAQLTLTTGGDPVQARDAVAALPAAQAASDLDVLTGADAIAAAQQELGEGAAAMTNMLLAFAAIALFVAALVIANTFSILVAQRTRSLALLRAIGADRGQVRLAVLIEALLVGCVGSLIGVAVGAGIAWAIVLVSRTGSMALSALVVHPASVLVPLAVGVLVTVLAGVVPARSATRVAPLAALRSTPEEATSAVARLRVALGALLVVAGTALLVYGAMAPELVLGIAGGAISFVGVLVLGPVIIPALTALVGALPARFGGVPGTLAVENARRNPHRAASTAGALLVGVTLITMMVVGAASGTASAVAALDDQFPVDGVVEAPAGLGEAEVARAENLADVQAATLVTGIPVTITAGGTELAGGGLMGVAADVTEVARTPASFTGLADGTILLSEGAGVADGAPVTVTAGEKSVQLTARVAADHGDDPVTTRATLAQLDANAPTQIWVRYAATADPALAGEHLAEALASVPGVRVGGAVAERAEMERLVDIVLMVVTGLLAMAVIIALVGIGNTLGLSVLERRRESGLLRALGLTKSSLRTMFGTEAGAIERRRGLRGTEASTSNPPTSRARAVNVPPTDDMRSFMPMRPWPCPSESTGPRPLSRTATSRRSARWQTSTCTVAPGPACLRVLVSASCTTR